MNVTVARSMAELTPGEFLAGGTDLGERLHSGTTQTPVIDITRLPNLDRITIGDGGAVIGALVRIAELGRHAEAQASYPGLTAIARTIATPQIRELATVGGVLCQRTRCWYYRHPRITCFKGGGDSCPADSGNNLYGVAFRHGPCAYPHPSSMALACLAYEANVDTTARMRLPIADLYGDGADPTRDHQLREGELLTHVRLPATGGVERASYVRLMSRRWAEWPLVECLARVRMEESRIALARVCIGGVANIPLRLPALDARLEGAAVTPAVLRDAAELAAVGAEPTRGGQDKRSLIVATALDALESACGVAST